MPAPKRAEVMAAFREMDALAAKGDTLEYREAFDKWASLALPPCKRCNGTGTVNLGTRADAEYWPCPNCMKEVPNDSLQFPGDPTDWSSDGMSAIEQLQEAIENLERLKSDSSPGPWTTKPEYPDGTFDYPSDGVRILHTSPHPREDYDRYIFIDGSYAMDPGTVSRADGELIATLHRTIDAQLAILRAALETATIWFTVDYEPQWDAEGPTTRDYMAALELMRAVLGVTTEKDGEQP